VQKNTDPADGRLVRVSLTAEASSLAPRIIAEVGELMAPMIDRLSVSEQHRLTALLDKVNGA
jgi:MarR family transcriptional regulator, lower aerobic nicotinate degradation pathway regulator